MLLGLFLTIKNRAFNTFDLYNRAEAAWAQDNAL